MSPGEVRINNARAVLTAVATSNGASAADLARRTGLVPQSIARILADLEQEQLITRGQARRGLRGQPPTPIHLNPEGAYALGCELGWRHYRIVLLDLAGNVLGEHFRQYDYPHAASIFTEIASVSRLLVNHIALDHRGRLLGMGLALPGSIPRNIELLGAPAAEIEAWQHLDPAQAAARSLAMEVFTFNDGNAACWSELVTLPPPRTTDMAYLSVGTFIGAGLVSNGHLWHGPLGNAANLGAMLVPIDDGPPQSVHLIASLYALEQRLQENGFALPFGPPEQWDWSAIAPIADRWLEEASVALALAIVNASAIAEFPLVIIGGVLPDDRTHWLIEMIKAHLQSWPALTTAHPTIVQAQLAGRSAAIGAAMMPIYQRYFSRRAADMGL